MALNGLLARNFLSSREKAVVCPFPQKFSIHLFSALQIFQNIIEIRAFHSSNSSESYLLKFMDIKCLLLKLLHVQLILSKDFLLLFIILFVHPSTHINTLFIPIYLNKISTSMIFLMCNIITLISTYHLIYFNISIFHPPKIFQRKIIY